MAVSLWLTVACLNYSGGYASIFYYSARQYTCMIKAREKGGEASKEFITPTRHVLRQSRPYLPIYFRTDLG